MPPKSLTASGRPISHHGPELYTFFNGAQHADGTLIALSHAYPDVTVIIADIVGFTALSSNVTPQELVDILNTIFTQFDDIMEDVSGRESLYSNIYYSLPYLAFWTISQTVGLFKVGYSSGYFADGQCLD